MGNADIFIDKAMGLSVIIQAIAIAFLMYALVDWIRNGPPLIYGD